MSYSKIAKFKVKNFRNVGSAEISFKESPIICLVGDNESGKTSIIKAFAVLGYNAYSRDQKDFINDSAEKFELELELEDGTSIYREKGRSNGYVVRKNGKAVWDCYKLDSDVPKYIEDIVGLLQEPETGEYLQVRTYEDKLLFVVTSASTNYKVIYNALKVENLTKAIRLGISKVNNLRKKIDENNSNIKAFNEQIARIKIYDIEPLIKLKERVENHYEIIKRMETVIQLKGVVERLRKLNELYKEADEEKLGDLSDFEIGLLNNFSFLREKLNELSYELKKSEDILNLKNVEETEANLLYNIGVKLGVLSEVRREIKIGEKVEKLEELNLDIYEKIEYIVKKKLEMKEKVSIYRKIAHLDEIDVNVLNTMKNIVQYKDRIVKIKNALNTAEERIKKGEEVCYALAKEANAIICDNCGNVMLIDR